jgi:hypothetical protein
MLIVEIALGVMAGLYLYHHFEDAVLWLVGLVMIIGAAVLGYWGWFWITAQDWSSLADWWTSPTLRDWLILPILLVLGVLVWGGVALSGIIVGVKKISRHH